MQFTVPQFIERAPKIVGPFTFKQFIFIGTAGGICLFLYFTVPFAVFIITTIFLLGCAFALAFIKIERIPLPIVIKNFFIFILSPKIYLWKKKAVPPKILEKPEEKEEEIKEKKGVLKIAEHSRLKELSTRVETKPK